MTRKKKKRKGQKKRKRKSLKKRKSPLKGMRS